MKTDAGDGGQEPITSAPLSSEFLEGNTETGLQKIRTRLLDLTNRNRLLNFRHSTASSLRVVDVDMDAVFRRLLDGKKLLFYPVPEPKSEFDSEERPGEDASENRPIKVSAADFAANLGWRTSFDLDHSTNTENFEMLPVLHYLEALETLTRKIGSAAKTAIEESGTNMLYLVFGFLEWYEDDNSQQPRYAPLLTVPVTLERKGLECTIEYSGDDFATNLSLTERMRRDFLLEIPSVEDEDSPEQYFARFEQVLNQKKRWRIRRQVTLTLLSFGKLLMYRDLDPKHWPEILKHPLVKELFEGSKSDSITHAEEYAIDDPQLRPSVPSLILDADSSQHSALIHALRGQNLVIEGPPGTGKSQTITNLIAAAIGTGKTVLFVAEKLAALEVVRRRLDEAGLGIFCLELHSHKTNKHALLADLDARLKARGSFREPRELGQHLAVVEEKKQVLTRYADVLNKRIEPFDASPFEILWARERFYRELPFTGEMKGNVPGARSYTPAQYDAKVHLLTVYAHHLNTVLRGCSSIEHHAWSWVNKPLSLGEEEQTVESLTSFLNSLRDTEQSLSELKDLSGITLDCSTAGLAFAAAFLSELPEAEEFDGHLLECCRDVQGREILRGLVLDLETYSAKIDELQEAFEDALPVLRIDLSQALQNAFNVIQSLQLQDQNLAQLQNTLANWQSTETLLHEAITCLNELQTFLGTEVQAEHHGIRPLLSCLRLLEVAPANCLHFRSPSIETDNARIIVQNAAVEARALLRQQEELRTNFDLSLVMDAEAGKRFSDHAMTVEEAGILQVWFGRDYRRAVKTHRRLAIKGQKATRNRMVRDFRALSEYCCKRSTFETRDEYREILGSHFRGIETDWDSMLALVRWLEEVFAALPEHDKSSTELRELLLKGRAERLRGLRASLVSKSKDLRILEQVRDVLPMITQAHTTACKESGTIQELLREIRGRNSQLVEALKLLSTTGLHSNVPVARVPDLLFSAATCNEMSRVILGYDSARKLLEARFMGVATDVKPIQAALAFAEGLADGKLPPESACWILSDDFPSRIEQLRRYLTRTASLRADLIQIGNEIAVTTGATCWSNGEPLAELKRRAERALECCDALPGWVSFLRVRQEIQEAGLAKLSGLAESKSIQPEHIVPAFRFLFYNSLARSLFEEHPALYEFDGITQEQVRQQFAHSDKASIRLHREQFASLIDRRLVPNGNQRGPVGLWTDLALITHEVNKQKRHIPIRQLVRRAGSALQALKPCFMMGPLSVAQYLSPGELRFDLIVMDEASQLKPEDAVGAIGRGSQIVIVGDPKQLPPTSFFQRVLIEAEENTDEQGPTVVEEGESILDVASTLYHPVRRLRWHYRSRHHSLIAFSNKEFYKDLVVFPSAYHDDPKLGVKYHSIPNGMFEGRRNAPEAEIVVRAVLEHMEQNPEESLGVVTLNLEQRELIEELLDKRLRTDPFAATYQERMNNGPEPFFVKNLENVQGDERDVMFISVTYGPDAKGNTYQRFGPINGVNGHRRLNVLFTRAKKRTEVFSSLDPDKIHTNPGSTWGLRALKEYLTFARTGVLETPNEDNGQQINDFERSVGAALKDKGYDVVPQVGVAGFFIDLAVRHPVKPGKFVLGVECDGASYHSGRSARDRDRLRQEILENLGWKIHRIWSTDWFRGRAAQIKRLLNHIEELLAADPDYLRESRRVKVRTSVREQLIDLREKEIRPAFPDSSPEQCLLREELLEGFVAMRPKSRDDWFRKFSVKVRTDTDSRQVAKFLDRIFEIIGDSLE